MRISDWSSDVCSSDLRPVGSFGRRCRSAHPRVMLSTSRSWTMRVASRSSSERGWPNDLQRSEEHTSELQSLMRISYAVFCLKQQNTLDYLILFDQHRSSRYNVQDFMI